MKYSRFSTPAAPVITNKRQETHVEDKSVKEEHTSHKLIPNLHKLIRDESVPMVCSSCGNTYISYEGLGQYKCVECENIMYDNYGKVRKCLDIVGSMTEIQLMEKTGLSRSDIRKLIEAGSLVRTTKGLSII